LGKASAARTLLVAAVFAFALDVVTFVGPEWGEDVAQHWVAARLAADGGDPYAEGALRHRGEEEGLIAPGQPSHHFLEQHHYPPFAVALATPLARVGFLGARLTWLAASVVCALASLPLLARVSGVPPGEARVVLAGLFLLFMPLRGALGLGQPDVFLLLLLLLGLDLDRTNRPGLAGLPLAAAALLKLLPFAWLLYFAARARWRVVASMLAWAAGLSALSLLVVPARLYRSFVVSQLAFAEASTGWQRYEPTNLSLTAWIFKAFAFATSSHDLEPAAGWLARIAAAALLAVVAVVIARARRGVAGMGLLVAAIALVSPLTWQHHLVVLILPLAIALRERLEDPRAIVTGFLLPYALVGLLDPRFGAWRAATAEWSRPARDVAWSILPLAVTAGIAWTGILAWRSTRGRG